MAAVCRITLALALVAASITQAQQPQLTPPPAFPYSFTNFIWWTDDGLRAEIHRRAPSLPDTIRAGSPQDHPLRSTLTAMLRQKGVVAEIQSISPPRDIFTRQRAPNAPLPSIAYSITEPPSILLSQFSLSTPNDTLNETLANINRRFANRPYDRGSFWVVADEFLHPLQNQGYLSAAVHFTPGTPAKAAPETYTVPVEISFDPGPQFHIASITADGGPLAQGHDLTPYFSAHPGDPAPPNPFARLEGALRGTYWSHGYLDVATHDAPVLDTAHSLASYSLTVDPGPQYHFKSLTTKGLNAAQEAYLHVHFHLKPGDIYDETAVTGLYRQLLPTEEFNGLSFSYATKKNRDQGTVEITLEFFKQQ